jgi:hypothetical protein|tara:strand:+ start:11614 stop:12006 length:393 start_codon:yes stop_codon:yes gene_type:complete
MITLQFINDVDNDSLQIGDMIYFQTPTPLGGFDQQLNAPIFVGPVVDIFNAVGVSISSQDWNPPMFSMEVDNINPGGTIPSVNDFIMFNKECSINMSGLVGYFAEVKIKNNSREKAEIFCLSSEITQSSK